MQGAALHLNELSDIQVKGKGDDLPASPIKVGNKSFRQNSKLQQVLDEI